MNEQRDLQLENRVALQTVQAMLGVVGSEFYAVAIAASANSVTVYFAVSEKTSEVEGDIEEIIFELDALLGGRTELHVEVYEGIPGEGWPGWGRRHVYLSKAAVAVHE